MNGFKVELKNTKTIAISLIRKKFEELSLLRKIAISTVESGT